MKAIKDSGSVSEFGHCCAGVANPGGNPSDRHALKILTLVGCLRGGGNFSATERPDLGTLGLWYSWVQGGIVTPPRWADSCYLTQRFQLLLKVVTFQLYTY